MLSISKCTYDIPKVNVKSEIDMEILMMVVMKYGVRLPGLPPKRLEINTRMVDDSVIVSIQGNNVEGTYKYLK